MLLTRSNYLDLFQVEHKQNIMKKIRTVLKLKKFKVANLNELHRLRGGEEDAITTTQDKIKSFFGHCPNQTNGTAPPPPPPTGGGNGSGAVAVNHL